MAGFRTFATGEVLTAANVNNFLMKQSVMVFADATARTAALGAEVAEGMLTYNEDTAQLEVFDGSDFVPAGAEPGLVATYYATGNTSQSIATTIMTDVTDLSITLTPASTSSKFLIIASIAGVAVRAASSGDNAAKVRLMRDATEVFQTETQIHKAGETSGGGSGAFSYLDEPATASEIVYKVQASSRTTDNFGSISIGGTGRSHSLSIFEVKA